MTSVITRVVREVSLVYRSVTGIQVWKWPLDLLWVSIPQSLSNRLRFFVSGTLTPVESPLSPNLFSCHVSPDVTWRQTDVRYQVTWRNWRNSGKCNSLYLCPIHFKICESPSNKNGLEEEVIQNSDGMKGGTPTILYDLYLGQALQWADWRTPGTYTSQLTRCMTSSWKEEWPTRRRIHGAKYEQASEELGENVHGRRHGWQRKRLFDNLTWFPKKLCSVMTSATAYEHMYSELQWIHWTLYV